MVSGLAGGIVAAALSGPRTKWGLRDGFGENKLVT